MRRDGAHAFQLFDGRLTVAGSPLFLDGTSGLGPLSLGPALRGSLATTRCAAGHHPLDERAAGVCEYVTAARRILVLPNAVKLVFIDDKKDVSNPAYPIWLHALDTGLYNPANYEKLCGSFREQAPGTTFARPFPEVHADYRGYVCADWQVCSQFLVPECTSLLEVGP